MTDNCRSLQLWDFNPNKLTSCPFLPKAGLQTLDRSILRVAGIWANASSQFSQSAARSSLPQAQRTMNYSCVCIFHPIGTYLFSPQRDICSGRGKRNLTHKRNQQELECRPLTIRRSCTDPVPNSCLFISPPDPLSKLYDSNKAIAKQ